ncbi:hypothetical protein F4779DRAFT_239500 [Xylariaceae sp. FL0662B]|nr:hypothetical protein F4779DRAFT_239500 [Xylariaceae sp. FL0662B]
MMAADDRITTVHKAMSDDNATEDEILDSINGLLERKLELARLRYISTLAPGVDSSSVFPSDSIRSQYDSLKIRVSLLINTYEGNIKDIIQGELGLVGEDSFGQFQEPAEKDQPPGLQSPSAMARKFLAAGDNDIWQPDQASIDAYEATMREGKETYFFYGTLMDAATLQRVLGLNERPQLKRATVTGYHTRLWGSYPALLDGPPGSVVRGMAYEVEGAPMKDRLAAYETDNYKSWGCIIDLDDGTEIRGTTFIWAGDEADLNEGSFDLKDWQMDHVLDQ